MNNWLDLSDNANTILSTIVDGFVDTSGGNIIIRENQHLEISGDVSFNQGGSFAVPTLKTDVLDTTGLVEVAFSKAEFVENPSFSQYAYDISGAESGGLAGQSISKNLAGDIIAVGAPLNSGGGTARGEVRVYQKDNNSWLQLGSDLNGAADNDEFGHSVDLNGDGTILGVGTKDTSNNLIIYQYDGSVWNQYGNNIHVVNNNISYNSHSLTPAIKVKLNKEGNKLVTMNKYNVADSQPGTTTVIVGPPFVQHGCTNNWDFRVASYGPITDDINSINVTYETGYYTNNAGASTVENGFLVDFYGTTGQFGSVAQAMKIQNGLTYGGSNLSFEIYINVIEWNEWSRLFRWHPTGYNYIEVARSANNRYAVRCDGDHGGSDITAAIGSFTTSSGKAIYTTNGQFLHIVFTISGGNVVVYHDGAQVGSGTLTNPQNVYTSSDPNMHSIGAYTDNGSSWGVAVNAYLRYFRYYHNKTLSASEVTDLYNNRDDTSTATDGTPTTVNTIITTDYENEVVQAYEYSSPSWNQIGNTIESSSLHDISGGDIAINDEGNMIAIGYPQSKSSIQGTYSYSVIPGADSNANLLYEFYGEEFTSDTGKPVLTFKRGSTYNLTISAGSHPFYIQTTENGGSYDSANVYNNGITNNGTGSGTITFVVPSDAPDTLYYVCQHHGNMGNSISIVNESGNDGRTKVFKYNTTDSSWNQVGNNIDGEGQAGTAVVMDGSGDFVAIGSPNINAGEVNVYQNVSDTWTLYGNKIQGQADNDQFGTSLDIVPSGTILAVGAVNANGGKGNVNIYQYNETDSSWNKLGGDLSGDAVGDLTGTSVKLNQLGTEVSVGEPNTKTELSLELSFSSDITLNWDFARDATGVTTIGDAGTTIGTIYGNNNTLTESEGFVGSGSGRVSSGNVNFVETSDFYQFPSDQFTVELYMKSTNSQVYLMYYRGANWNPTFYSSYDSNNTRMLLFPEVASSPSFTDIGFSDSSKEDDVWKHYIYVCDMAPSGGGNPQITLYVDNTLIQTKTFPFSYWYREGTSNKLGIFGNSNVNNPSINANVKKFKVINKLLNTEEISELYSNSTTGPLTLGRVRTFEIENNKFYNGMTNPTFGIGVTNPTNRLDVDGTVYIDGKLQTNDLSQNSGTTTVSGDLTFNGSISVSSVNNSSLTYDTDMSVNLLKRLFVNPNDISTYGEASQTHASDLSDNTPPIVWNQIATHYNPEPISADYFGYAVDINGDGTVIVVSVWGNDSGSQQGRVGVFQYDGANWSQKGDYMYGMTTLTSDLAGAAECVSINYYGNRVAWGAKTARPDNGYNRGYILAYDYNAGTNTWDLMGGDVVLKGAVNNHGVGDKQQVSLNKSTDSSIDGKFLSTVYRSLKQAFVYEWNGSAWNQKGTTIDDGDSSNSPSAVKMVDDGTSLVVGMSNAGDNAINSNNGGFAVYYWSGSDWTLRGDIVYGTGFQDYFGTCVDINSDGTIVVATARTNDDMTSDDGHMRIFQYNSSNDTWEQKGNTVTPSIQLASAYSSIQLGGYDALGMDGAGSKIVVGTWSASLRTGYLYEYISASNTWEITNEFTRAVETGDNYYSFSCRFSRDGRTIIIGDPYYDKNGLNSAGAVDVYQLPTASPIYEFDVDISFNHSLVVPGNLVIVDGSNNTSYGSYTTYTNTDLDTMAASPANKSYHVGKSKSNVFNIVNQDNIGVYMNTGDTSFTSTSDERLKHNIQDTEDSLEKICALQPRKFKWKYNDKSESGFIAQEIEKVFPEMVDENTLPDGKTIKGVNHSSLLPYILDSLQSLDKEIDNLINE